MYALFLMTDVKIPGFPKNPGVYLFKTPALGNQAIMQICGHMKWDGDPPETVEHFQMSLGVGEFCHLYPVSKQTVRRTRVSKGTRPENV